MWGVILAAGRGKRLNPLTSTRPKHLLPVLNRPLIRLVAESVTLAGIDEICVVVGYGSEMIRSALANFDKARITFAVQKEPLGTADALLSAEECLKSEDKFVVVYGDLTLEPEPLRELIEIVNSGYDGGIIGIKRINGERFGVLFTKDGLLEKIVEKPEKAPSAALINSGIYVLPREVLATSKRIEKSIRGEYELTDAITKLVSEGRRIFVHVVEGDWWLDVGRPSDLLAANLRLLKESLIDQNSEISKDAAIVTSVIMRGVKVGRGAVIKSSLIMENATIGPKASLSYCIVAEGSEVGHNSCLVGELYSPIVVGPGVKVPPNTLSSPGTIFQ